MANKYYNHKVATSDGIVHDSKREAKRWGELLLLQKAGLISNLQRQVKFVLIPAAYEVTERYSPSGKRLKDSRRLVERECAYIADFVYEENGQKVVEDTKGMRTKDYVIKRKMMLYLHGIRIKEI